MKKTITSKIIISYIIIILICMACVGLIFNFTARRYMEKQARDNLEKDAKVVVDAFKKNYSSDHESADSKIKQYIRDRIKKGAASLDVDYAIVTRDGRILYPRIPSEESLLLRNLILPELRDTVKGRFNAEDNVYVKVQVRDSEYMVSLVPEVFTPLKAESLDNIKIWVILYTPVGQVQALTNGMLLVLMLSLVLTVIPAVMIGILIARSVAKPIILLKHATERLSRREFDSKVEIDTGDELEELAQTVNKMAVELKEYDFSQKRFLQNASHELKTPLMSIQGYAEGIKDGVFEDNGKALEIIVDESTRLKKIVDEIIYLSKLETMEDFYKFDLESFNEIIEKSIEKINSLAVKNDVKIHTFLYKDARFKMDRDKLTQALINILGNCLRYARSEISVTTSNDGPWFVIRINDDGEGFDEKDLPKVFEQFYKGKKGNTGLGMAITKVIVEKHGGTITASNGATGGAEFTIRMKI